MTRRRFLTLLTLPLACLTSCVAWLEEENVLISSEPPGASIFVDGVDTGHTTPRVLAIGGNLGSDRSVRLEKDGFRAANRRLYQQTEVYTSKLIDGAFEVVVGPLPFFWTAGDFALPLGVRGALLPRELHVRLQRDDEPRLGFDLLAARRDEQEANK